MKIPRDREEIEEALKILNQSVAHMAAGRTEDDLNECPDVQFVVGAVAAIAWVLKRQVPLIDPTFMQEMIDELRGVFAYMRQN